MKTTHGHWEQTGYESGGWRPGVTLQNGVFQRALVLPMTSIVASSQLLGGPLSLSSYSVIEVM